MSYAPTPTARTAATAPDARENRLHRADCRAMLRGSGLADAPASVLAAQLPLAAAWARVQAKAGMPGTDGRPVSRFAREAESELRALEQGLASGTYLPDPLRVAVLGKKAGGRRILLVSTVRDRVAQAAVATWLGAKWDAGFDTASFGYRPGLGVHSALRYLRALRDRGYRWVFDADIQGFFDAIDHSLLLARLGHWLGASSPMLEWIRGWLVGPIWDGGDLTRLASGVPQGSPLSPLLANFFLDGFDRALREARIRFVRYADDFVVVARTPFDLAAARDTVVAALTDLGLNLNFEKTQTTTFDRWFKFLGAELQGDAILLPFEKTTAPLDMLFLAPPMPAALLRAYRMAQLRPKRDFDRARYQAAAPGPATAPVASTSATTTILRSLAGGAPERQRSGSS